MPSLKSMATVQVVIEINGNGAGSAPGFQLIFFYCGLVEDDHIAKADGKDDLTVCECHSSAVIVSCDDFIFCSHRKIPPEKNICVDICRFNNNIIWENIQVYFVKKFCNW